MIYRHAQSVIGPEFWNNLKGSELCIIAFNCLTWLHKGAQQHRSDGVFTICRRTCLSLASFCILRLFNAAWYTSTYVAALNLYTWNCSHQAHTAVQRDTTNRHRARMLKRPQEKWSFALYISRFALSICHWALSDLLYFENQIYIYIYIYIYICPFTSVLLSTLVERSRCYNAIMQSSLPLRSFEHSGPITLCACPRVSCVVLYRVRLVRASSRV